MIITSLLTKFHRNPTSSLWEILLTSKQTNKQTDKQTNTRRWLQYPAFRGIKICLKLESPEEVIAAKELDRCVVTDTSEDKTNDEVLNVIKITREVVEQCGSPLKIATSEIKKCYGVGQTKGTCFI